MNTLGRIDIFLEVAQSGSFIKAARKLGISGPAATKQVQTLEAELGVKLLHRSTRHVALTEEGERYFARARVALDELKSAATELQDARAKPKGLLRINAPMSFGHMHLLPVMTGFAKKYPEIEMHVSLDDRRVDVLADGYDVVIRIGSIVDSALSHRHIAHCPLLMVASPGYLREHGTPKTVAELSAHRHINYTMNDGPATWRLKTPRGRVEVVRAKGAFEANTAEMMREAALAGLGITVLPIFSVSSYIQAGQLVRVMRDHSIDPARDIVALMPPNRYRSSKVQLFLDWLAQSCKAMPWESEANL